MLTGAQLKRLRHEYEGMKTLCKVSSLLTFKAVGMPPTRYEVTLACSGLRRDGDRLVTTDRHEFDIVLGEDFPDFPPQVVWKSPIFHPNFHGASICLGTYWYGGWSLAQMCEAICDMVQFKVFNVHDPLDSQAAQWVGQADLDTADERFPIDTRPLRDLDFVISSVPR